MLGLIRIQNVWHSDCIPERIFREKNDFENSADNKKAGKISGSKELIDEIHKHYINAISVVFIVDSCKYMAKTLGVID